MCRVTFILTWSPGEDEMLMYARPWCGCGTQGRLPPTGRDYSALLPSKNLLMCGQVLGVSHLLLRRVFRLTLTRLVKDLAISWWRGG